MQEGRHIVAALAGVAALFVVFGLGLMQGASLQPFKDAPSRQASCPHSQIAKSDLCAQWKSADAAQQAANAADETVSIGWLGLAFGVVTMAAAIAAAKFAKDAALHTRDANKITLDVQRAWITLSAEPQLASTSIDDGLYFRTDLIAKNVGGTVATHFNVRSKILFETPGESTSLFVDRMKCEVDAWAQESRVDENRILPPNGINRSAYWTSIDEPELIIGHILNDYRVTYPILLVAAIFRLPHKPEYISCCWQAWRIASTEENGEALSCLRLDQKFTASRLEISPVTGLVYEERAA